MTDFEKLKTFCQKSLLELELPSSLQVCQDRLDLELQEIQRKEEAWMFLRFYNAIKKNKIQPIANNEHNLFTWWLLGVCPSVNIKRPPSFTDAELPDIDVDYIPEIRDALKDLAFEKYGHKRVSNIVTYQTYAVKSALIDIARVLCCDRDEILHITTRLGMKNDEKDDISFSNFEDLFVKIEQKEKEGKSLTKFEKLAKELESYRKQHPMVWEVASHLVAADIDWELFKYNPKSPPRRKKSMGMHASGLIISGANLSEFVPLVTPPGSREKGLQATAWTEGLADTDCSSVGLIKFDYLGLEANSKIAECNRLIMERHGLKSVCALPGLPNWSDTSYLNDPKALALANEADLLGVFQFDSPGIRKLAKKGGVTSFDDLVAYSAIYRPGPLDEKMDEEYCDRKNRKKSYTLHPLLQPILKNTYGVMIFQEQISLILNKIGGLPMKDCDAIRKAISKKKEEKFIKYKKVFIENASKILGHDEAVKIFDLIYSFASYGFNKSHSVEYTYISARQLWQKAHYPLEFYASALKSLKTGDERIISYVRDARRHDIPINALTLNKSGYDFRIVENEIYYGYSKIKGIGHEVASRIIENQPYSGIQDFLERFGRDAKVLTPLISLRLFKERDPDTLFLYYEGFKKAVKAENDRVLRYNKSIADYYNTLKELDPTWEHGFDDSYLGQLRPRLDDKQWIAFCKVKKKYDKCVETYETKKNEYQSLAISDFNPKALKIDKSAYKRYKAIKPVLKNPDVSEAEARCYGFPWKNEFEKIPNIKGFTFSEYEIDSLRADGRALPVEAMIISKELTTSKSGKMQYWKLRVTDADDAIKNVSVWEHDYERFEALLQVGHVVRMRLLPPQDPYPNYSLEGMLPWQLRMAKRNPYGEDPKLDYRVVLLGRGEKKKKFIDDEDDTYLLRVRKTKKKIEEPEEDDVAEEWTDAHDE